ncbi:MAG: porphobilinogen synthase [Proteobacteria bacterium]|nr:porphobilinogen synthase [Pseudomonadota bacterium]
MNAQFPTVRLRRLRQNPAIRALVRETELSIHDLVLPLFIRHGKQEKRPIQSMPGHFQLSVDQLDEEIKTICELNIPGVMLFGIPEYKDAVGSESYNPDSLIATAIKKIKDLAPHLVVMTDVCLCEYTDHGHCGVLNSQKNDVDNEKTLELLAKQAVTYAEAGADVIAPSGMMDGMVAAIRTTLDAHHFTNTLIQSYSTKYCSALYGPFREAAEGAPKLFDRSTYQMDPANTDQALRETALDVEEGADMLMVKPATLYLDIIYRIKQLYPGIPLSAYQVSGEFAMIKAAAEKGWIHEEKVAWESLLSIKRAGADFIITYFAKDVAKLIIKN